MLRRVVLVTAAVASAHLSSSAAAGGQAHGSSVRVGVRRTPEGLAELERLFWAIATPGTPEFQQYLSPAQLLSLRASSPGDTAAVVGWLRAAGCEGAAVVETGDAVTASGCPERPLTPTALAEVVEFVHVAGPSRVETAVTSHAATTTGRDQPPRPPPAPPNLGTPARQRDFYALPQDQRSHNASNLQMVWGCGTFGVNKTELGMFYDEYCSDCDLDDVAYDTVHHGMERGDNFMEGTLDTTYISSFGKGTRTLVSNTNISMATEEGEGQGIATVIAFEEIAQREKDLPLVLSLSLGSLAFDACDALCKVQQAALNSCSVYFTQLSSCLSRACLGKSVSTVCTLTLKAGRGVFFSSQGVVESSPQFTYSECHDYMQKQRQICLYASEAQQARINVAFQMMGARGVTVLGAHNPTPIPACRAIILHFVLKTDHFIWQDRLGTNRRKTAS
jgi:hypothetical protein